jgi:hypothetical protein
LAERPRLSDPARGTPHLSLLEKGERNSALGRRPEGLSERARANPLQPRRSRRVRSRDGLNTGSLDLKLFLKNENILHPTHHDFRNPNYCCHLVQATRAAAPTAAARRNRSTPPIPTGLCLAALGCEARATQGNETNSEFINPEGVVAPSGLTSSSATLQQLKHCWAVNPGNSSKVMMNTFMA